MKYTQPLKTWWLTILIAIMVVVQGCASKAPATAPQAAPVVITKVEPRDIDGRTEIMIEGTGPLLQYTSFQLTDPLRLVVDIADADLGTLKDKISYKSGAVTEIAPSQKDTVARFEIGLSQAVDTKVNQLDGKLVVEVAKPVVDAKSAEESKQAAEIKPAPEVTVSPVPQEAPKEEKVETPQPEMAAATIISSVKASAGKDGVKVVISGNGTINAKILKLDGNRIAINIPGVTSKARPNVIPVRKGGLLRVRIGQHPDKVSVVLDLTKPMDYTATPEGNTLVVSMNGASVVAKRLEKPAKELAASQEQQAAVSEKEGEPVAPVLPSVSEPTQAASEKKTVVPQEIKPAKQESPLAGKTTVGGTESSLLAGGTKYTGRKISLDLQDADLINVMRLFAEVANLNIILSPDVKGKVTVRMVNIPWDQAMEIILKMNGLGYLLDDNVLRIASVGALTKEAEEESKAKEAKKKAEDLITRIVPINYATAATIEPTIKKSLSARGETVIDARTNTLIVKDIPRNVDDIVSLIKVLDKPIAQIMIEARIVEASLNFTRQIGVQWGGTASASASTGNPISGLSSASVTGSPLAGSTTSGNGNWLVNLPAAIGTGSGGAIAFALSSLNKAYNLDLALSALESTGEGKVISQPKISALDNKEAKIEQGLSIPYSTTSSSGTQIQFIDAKLALTVTPHATPDNKIFLKITAMKNAPDTSVLGATGQPSIRKNEATTEILLADGETAVIGGILTLNRTVTDSMVPWFGNIPIIGWLFKNRTTNDVRGELLIFITPRLVKQEVI
jgi:type IV pilus assembly protein PilQ